MKRPKKKIIKPRNPIAVAAMLRTSACPMKAGKGGSTKNSVRKTAGGLEKMVRLYNNLMGVDSVVLKPVPF